MKHTTRCYYVQSRAKNEMPKIVAHSEDEETGEKYYKFLDVKKANKLLKDERAAVPELQYAVVKETTTHEILGWQ